MFFDWDLGLEIEMWVVIAIMGDDRRMLSVLQISLKAITSVSLTPL